MKNRFFTRAAAAAAALFVAAGTLGIPACASEGKGIRSNREMNSQTTNSVYLIPDGDTYYITEDDISWMDDKELMLARNEFYARKGRRFVVKSIRDYFNSQSWYDGRIAPENFTTDLFNRYEMANVDFIVAYEQKRAKGRSREDDDEWTDESSGLDELTIEYKRIRDLYEDAFIQSWTKEESRVHGRIELVPDMKSPKELGYTCRDIDGDGIEELIVGPTDTRKYGEGAVFGIYTLKDGEVVRTASADKDIRFYICEGGTVRKEKKYEDGSWEIDYYNFKGGDLILKGVLVMDEEEGGDAPWFAATDEQLMSMDGGISVDDTSEEDQEDASGIEIETDRDKRGKSEKDIESWMEEETDDDGDDDDDNNIGGLHLSYTDTEEGEAAGLGEISSVKGGAADAEGFEELSPITYKEASKIRATYSADRLRLISFE